MLVICFETAAFCCDAPFFLRAPGPPLTGLEAGEPPPITELVIRVAPAAGPTDGAIEATDGAGSNRGGPSAPDISDGT